MFRQDRCKILRPIAHKINGELTYENVTIAEFVSCHLSVKSISAVNQSDSTATVLYDYTLFIDRDLNIEIKPNDIIEATRWGKTYKLRAGESAPYPLTIQTHCEVLDIV